LNHTVINCTMSSGSSLGNYTLPLLANTFGTSPGTNAFTAFSTNHFQGCHLDHNPLSYQPETGYQRILFNDVLIEGASNEAPWNPTVQSLDPSFFRNQLNYTSPFNANSLATIHLLGGLDVNNLGPAPDLLFRYSSFALVSHSLVRNHVSQSIGQFAQSPGVVVIQEFPAAITQLWQLETVTQVDVSKSRFSRLRSNNLTEFIDPYETYQPVMLSLACDQYAGAFSYCLSSAANLTSPSAHPLSFVSGILHSVFEVC